MGLLGVGWPGLLVLLRGRLAFLCLSFSVGLGFRVWGLGFRV